jgi:hypothetical protein
VNKKGMAFPAVLRQPEWWLVIAAFLTLGAVTWQSILTRRYVNISVRNFVATFRPKVLIRSIILDPETVEDKPAGPCKIRLLLVNTGGTIAYVDSCEFSLDWFDIEKPTILFGHATDSSFSLVPGQSRSIDLEIPGSGFPMSLYSLEVNVREGARQKKFPMCSGTITYTDDNKIQRRTGFQRVWDVSSRRFAASTDTEYEYAD